MKICFINSCKSCFFCKERNGIHFCLLLKANEKTPNFPSYSIPRMPDIPEPITVKNGCCEKTGGHIETEEFTIIPPDILKKGKIFKYCVLTDISRDLYKYYYYGELNDMKYEDRFEPKEN